MTALRVYGGSRGGGAGGGPEMFQSPPPPTPRPGEPPAPLCVQESRPGPSAGARGATSGCVRASRLLGVFTRRNLLGIKPPPVPPRPTMIVAGLEEKRLDRAKIRIHKVVVAHYPSCRRIMGLLRAQPEILAAGGDFAARGQFSAPGNSAAEASVVYAPSFKRAMPDAKLEGRRTEGGGDPG